jgi:hypothetical protein
LLEWVVYYLRLGVITFGLEHERLPIEIRTLADYNAHKLSEINKNNINEFHEDKRRRIAIT